MSQCWDRQGRTIWIADAHSDDGKRFVVRADEILTVFLELEIYFHHLLRDSVHRVADCIVPVCRTKGDQAHDGSLEMPSGIYPGHNCNEDKNYDSDCEKNKESLSFA